MGGCLRVTLVFCFGPKPKFCSLDLDLDQAEQNQDDLKKRRRKKNEDDLKKNKMKTTSKKNDYDLLNLGETFPGVGSAL